jgi:hypothetical protein
VYLLHTTSFATLDEVKNYKSLQSFKYFSSGWVLDVGWKRYDDQEVVLVTGRVRHSYAASKAPLRPWIIIGFNGVVQVAHCTCMAGLAETCSHVGAVLHWVETAVRIRNDEPCTSKENKWLMPTPVNNIPFLQIRDIDFTTSKHQSRTPVPVVPSSSNNKKIEPPSHSEKQEFFSKIAQELEKKPIILSVTQPYSSNFALSSDSLPKLLDSLYKPEYLESDYDDLLKLAESHLHEKVTPAMVEHLSQVTCEQTKSKEWYKYRAGRITASRFRQVIHTNCHKPSLSLLKSICYPEVDRFTTIATKWGLDHEINALTTYQNNMTASHNDFALISCGFYVHTEYPFLGASPDALVECKCCGKGVVEVKCPLTAQESSFADAADKVSFCLEVCSDGKYKLKHQHQYYYQCQLQIFVTGYLFCDFVVWTEKELHIERLTLAKGVIASLSSVYAILPELLGKWYTHKRSVPGNSAKLHVDEYDEDNGSWCLCKEKKVGDMVGCDNKSCAIKWFHLE